MSYIQTITTAALIAAACTAAPAFASPQDDVAACRAEITQQNPDMLDGYRLRFKSTKGNQNRVLALEAIPNVKSAGERFKLTCRLNKTNSVLAFNTAKAPVKFAQK
jgi:hypothetical protein